MAADHEHDDNVHANRVTLVVHLAREHDDVELNRIDDLDALIQVHEAAHATGPDLWLARCDVCPWQGDYPTSKADAQRDLGRHVMREHSPGRAS